jgi:hypothetical protein
VKRPSHLEFAAEQSLQSTNKFRYEVYTGNFLYNLYNVGPPTSRNTIRTFVPIDTNRLRFYPSDEILDAAVLAAPISFTGTDFDTTCSIDDYEIKIEPHTFVGIVGAKNCLVLTVKVGLLYNGLHRVGYHITLKTKGEVTDKGVDGEERPAEPKPEGVL